MKHADHVNLLRGGVPAPGGVWADLGAGTGAFTLALAELLGPAATIYAIDKNAADLRELTVAMCERFPEVGLRAVTADFTGPLDLPPLDGVVMANSLHYLRSKDAMVQRVRAMLKPGGRLLIVEYNVDRGNLWVPYPLSYRTWESIAAPSGFTETRLLATTPSRFLQEFYSAVSIKGDR